jgi:hypothetical protein
VYHGNAMTEFTAEKQRPGHLFKPGQSGNPAGRPRGARSKLSENFLSDLAHCWQEHGPAALRRCAIESPERFCQIVASVLPKDIRIDHDLTVDVGDFVTRFRNAVQLLGNDPEPPRLRRSLRVIEQARVIDDA